jgi:hypothetical protein
MEPITAEASTQPGHVPWNKGKLIGPKPPLQPKHVKSAEHHGRQPCSEKPVDIRIFAVAPFPSALLQLHTSS